MLNFNEVKEIEIEFTTFCNAKCPLCFRNYKSFQNSIYDKPFSRDFQDVTNQLDDFKNLNFVMLVGSLSEPTLYVHFLDVVKYLKSRNIQIEICTNGDTHDEQWWKELGNILDDDDMVYFTICGSKQDIHQIYRRNTNLENILKNAKALRNSKPIDYAQCIRFNYNSDDFDTIDFNNLVSSFTHIYMTETFFPKDMSNYIEQFSYEDFLPNKAKYNDYIKVKTLTEKQFSSNRKYETDCASIRDKRIQIDCFGNIYPCYLYLEYSCGRKWDQKYNNIKTLTYDCCKFCEKNIHRYCVDKKLDYII